MTSKADLESLKKQIESKEKYLSLFGKIEALRTGHWMVELTLCLSPSRECRHPRSKGAS